MNSRTAVFYSDFLKFRLDPIMLAADQSYRSPSPLRLPSNGGSPMGYDDGPSIAYRIRKCLEQVRMTAPPVDGLTIHHASSFFRKKDRLQPPQ